MKTFYKVVAASFFVFFFSWVFVYKTGINPLSIQSEDALPAMFLPVTIIKEGTFYVDTYYEVLRAKYPHPDDKSFEKGLTPFYLRKVEDHYISAFTLAAGLLSVPVYFLPLIFGLPVTLENVTVLAHISAGLIVSLSGGFLYLLLRNAFFLERKKSLLLTAVYLVGSVNYALVSQALWQHGAVQLFCILGLLFLYKKKWILVGLMFGLAVLARPTAAIVVFFMGLLIIAREIGVLKSYALKPFLGVILGVLPVVLFFIWYNSVYYMDIANQGYATQVFSEWRSRLFEGFLGLWISPSKGILFYSPVFIFSLVGFYLAVHRGRWRENFDYVLFFCIIVLHTAVLGKWKHWYGGYSFGYRMASDILPFLILLMIPFVQSEYFEKFKRLFWGSFVFSVLVQIFGMIFFDGIWHGAYDRGFADTTWLWSIENSEFIFNVRRILVKLGILEKACPKCLLRS